MFLKEPRGASHLVNEAHATLDVLTREDYNGNLGVRVVRAVAHTDRKEEEYFAWSLAGKVPPQWYPPEWDELEKLFGLSLD